MRKQAKTPCAEGVFVLCAMVTPAASRMRHLLRLLPCRPAVSSENQCGTLAAQMQRHPLMSALALRLGAAWLSASPARRLPRVARARPRSDHSDSTQPHSDRPAGGFCGLPVRPILIQSEGDQGPRGPSGWRSAVWLPRSTLTRVLQSPRAAITTRSDAANGYGAADRFRDLVEHTSDLVWEIDAVGHCSYVSPSVTTVLGFTATARRWQAPHNPRPPRRRLTAARPAAPPARWSVL